jgi:uncharacterized repeat protein (TIGR01451 family)
MYGAKPAVVAGAYDVALSKSTIAVLPLKYGVTVPMNITIHNQGDSIIRNIKIIDYVPEGLEYMSFINAGWAYDIDVPNGVTTTVAGPINPGGTQIVTLNLIVRPGDSADDWDNYAEVVSFQNISGQQREGQDMDSVADKIYNNDGGAGAFSPSDGYILGAGGGVFGDGVAATDEDDHDVERVRVMDFALRNKLITAPGYGYTDDLVFEITIFNQGNETASEVFIIDYIPEGYVYDPVLNGANGWLGTGTPGYEFNNINPGDSAKAYITLKLDMDMFDGQAWDNYVEVFSIRDASGLLVNANEADSTPNSDSSYENQVKPGDFFDNKIDGNGQAFGEDEDDHDPAAPVIYDLALIKSRITAVPSYSYGQEIEYFVEVFNQGNMSVKEVVIVDTIACGFIFDQDLNPDWIYDQNTNKLTYTITDTIAPVQSVIVLLNLIAAPCYDDPDNAWTNYAEIKSAKDLSGNFIEDIDGTFDDNFTNDPGAIADGPTDDMLMGNAIIDEDNHDVEKIQIVDLALKKVITTQGPYVIGQPIDFKIWVYNQGNVIQKNIRVIDYIPQGFSYVSGYNNPLGWVFSGSSAINNLQPRLNPGDSTSVNIRMLYLPNGNEPKDYFNYAHIYISQDTLNNNRFDDADSNPFIETAAERSVEPNDPDDDNIFALGLNFDEDQDDHDPAGFNFFDLELTKEIINIPADFTYGDEVTFEISIENTGTRNASFIEITDYIPCGFSLSSNNTEWTVDGSTGYLKHQKLIDIGPNEIYTKQLVLVIVECQDNNTIDPWNNVAEISKGYDDDGLPGDDQDSNPDSNPNNDADDEDDIDDDGIIVNDLNLEKDLETQGEILYGDIIRFNIIITNEGNQVENNVIITDYLPCGYEFVSNASNAGWSINSQNGYYEYTILTPMSPGDITIVSLDLRVVKCTDGGVDNYRNEAEISSGIDIDSTPNDIPGDPDDEDDSDDENIDIYDLSLVKEIAQLGTVAYGEDVTFILIITNEGNVPASNITIVDYLPCGYKFNNISGNNGWTIDLQNGYLNYFSNTTLQPGDQFSVLLTLEFQECQIGGVDNYRNKAEIKDSGDDVDSTPDDNPNNDFDGEDDNDDIDIGVFDLSLIKTTNTNLVYKVGDLVVYSITVTNEGNLTANSFEVIDHLDCGLLFSNIPANIGWNLTLGGAAVAKTINNPLAPGQSTTLNLTLTVQECQTDQVYDNYAEILNDTDENGDDVTDVDSTPDDNPNNDLDGEDDNDETTITVEIELAEITGTVWIDEDSDGLFDNNEPLVEDVLVQLYKCNGLFVTSTTTDANGDYLFNNISSGSYKIRFIISGLPIEYDFTAQDQGNNDDIDSDANTSGRTGCFDYNSSIGKDNVDAGLLYRGSIGDFVWDDRNGNGIQDFNEPGIEGVEVSLYNAFGIKLSTVTTNLSGYYIINNVSQGQYYLLFDAEDTYEVTKADQGNNNFDSDITSANGDFTTDLFFLNAGQTLTNMDGGLFECLNVCGIAWYDVNENDIMNSNENGINGLEVNLWKWENGNWEIWKTTETQHKPNTPSDDGYFEFCTAPGTYYVEVVMPPQGLVLAVPFVGGSNVDSDINNANGVGTTNSFNIINGQSKCDLGAGYYPMATVGNLVWRDDNSNGVQESNEPRLANVMVEAFDINDVKIAETYTDVLGIYEIDYLQKQSYYLRFTPDASLSATIPNNSNEDFDSDIDHTNGLNTTKMISFAPGDEVINVDGGFAFGVLPVEWINIDVEQKDKAHLVSWEVASERNIDIYEIERSINGISDFENIGKLNFKTPIANTNIYTYLDIDIKKDGIYYYRIKQVDLDGKYSYSDIVKVLRNSDSSISIYPNPCVSSFNVLTNVIVDDEVTVLILDNTGRLIKTINQDGSNMTYDVSDLEAGYYTIKLELNNVVYQQKLIKIN